MSCKSLGKNHDNNIGLVQWLLNQINEYNNLDDIW